MTDNINVQIIEPPLNNLIIETQIGSEPISVNVVSYSGTNISVTHDLPILPSDINDNVAGLLVAGSGIVISYDNNIPSITISSSGTQLDSEQVQDIIGSLITGSGYVIVNYNDSLNNLVVSVTGLQPSGNYSLAGHTHTSNDISDFNNAFSGLLPVKNIISGSGIAVSVSSGDFTIGVTGSFGLTSEEVDDRVNQLLVGGSYISLNYNDNLNTLTISSTGLQPSGIYASGIHTHVSSDIIDLNNSISGILPSVSGSQYIVTNFSNNIYTISATGLQPSGSYAQSIHNHSASDITNFNVSVSGLVDGIYAPLYSPSFSGIPTAPTASGGTNTNQIASTSFVRNEISNLVNSAPSTLDTLNELAAALGDDPNFATTVASGLGQKANIVHTHEIADITNFNSGVSGLLPNISGSGYVFSVFSNNTHIIAVSGLQPSGNYSAVGHSHVSSDITNFNSSVSGVINSALSTSISGGVGIDLSYYSNTDTLLISTSGVSLVGHQHTSSEITDFNTAVRTNRLDQLTAPNANVSFNNYRLTNLATPVSGTDGVNKNYIDNLQASTSGLGIASFSSGDFSVTSGVVSVKNSGIDNNQLYYSYITLGTSTINLGSSVNSLSGLVLDGGTP